MNLFRNLYYDKEEIIEWLKQDEDALNALNNVSPKTDINTVPAAVLTSWLQDDEDSAKRYREYHFHKQWEDAQL